MQPDLILTPFAEDALAGNIDSIPETLGPGDPPQAASWRQGFPPVTMTPLAAGGIPPRGQSFNGVLHDISEHLVYIGGGGQYLFSPEFVAEKGGYAIGAVLQSNDGKTSYRSAVALNTKNFNTDPASIGVEWIPYAGEGITPGPASESNAGVIKVSTQAQTALGADDATAVSPKKRALAAQTQSNVAFATTGTATAQVLTPSPAITAYAVNQRFSVTFNASSGANPTINISGVGAKSLKKYDGSGAKVAATFFAGQISDIVYDGVDFVVLGAASGDLLNSSIITIPASATIDLNSSAQNTSQISISGSGVNIGGFAVTAGRCFIIGFTGSVTLVNGVDLSTNLGANITTAAGDSCIIRSTAANKVEVLAYVQNPSSRQLLAPSGHKELEGGFIMQWGTRAATGTSTVTFPVSFKEACYSLVAGAGSSGGFPVTSSVSVTSFSMTSSATDNRWIAVGK